MSQVLSGLRGNLCMLLQQNLLQLWIFSLVIYVWRGGIVVRVGLATESSHFRVLAAPLHVRPWASCLHTCASVHQAV